MLRSLYIKNFIIIDNVNVNFCDGFNVIIGETGAGKSILMDALMLVFGGRASSNIVRGGTTKSIIEANFYLSNRKYLLSAIRAMDVDITDDELIIRREISANGNSRCFINDSPISLNVLKSICSLIVDFHGQGGTYKLFSRNEQLNTIDALLNDKEVLTQYKKIFSEFEELLYKYNILQAKNSNSDYRTIQLEREIKEIETISPEDGELEKIDSELKFMETAEERVVDANAFIELLEAPDTLENLNTASRHLEYLNKADSSFGEYKEEFFSALVSLKESLHFVREYRSNINYSPQKIESLRQRYAAIRGLMKKYGSISEIQNKRRENELELEDIKHYEEQLIELRDSIFKMRHTLGKQAELLSIERNKAAETLSKQIIAQLAKLGIPDAKMEVHWTSSILSAHQINEGESYVIINNENKVATKNGVDTADFYISTNKGVPPSLLSDTISGGEASRVMLAIKSIMSEIDTTPILFFDEIDTGVSGRIASKVGVAMRNLSAKHQVFAITHLPQVAALGEQIHLVEKLEIEERNVSRIRTLSDKTEQAAEIARMLSGEVVTDSAIASAKVLMNEH